jgi:hypothetical protein
MKKIFLSLILFFILVSLPIYAATRILLPDWLKEKVSVSLPMGTELHVGKVSSLYDLTILYEDVVYQTPTYKMEFDKFFIEPRVDMNSPLVLKVETLELTTELNNATFRNLEIKIVFPDISFDDVLLDGQISQIEGPYKSILLDSKFIFEGLKKANKILDFKIENFSSEIVTSKVVLKLKANKMVSKLHFNEKLSLTSNANNVGFELVLEDPNPISRTLESQNVSLDFDFVKTNVWNLPIRFRASSILSPRGHVVDTGELNARGRWNEASLDCNLSEMLTFSENCGKMIDVLDLSISLEDKNGNVNFKGNGFCVAPKSGCRQRINSEISSKSTAEIFSQFMSSGLINPLVGGVILGGLLGSPSAVNQEYDHSIQLDMIGSQILLNGKPLI